MSVPPPRGHDPQLRDAEQQPPIDVEVVVERRPLAPGLPATRYPVTAVYVVLMLALLLAAELFQWRL